MSSEHWRSLNGPSVVTEITSPRVVLNVLGERDLDHSAGVDREQERSPSGPADLGHRVDVRHEPRRHVGGGQVGVRQNEGHHLMLLEGLAFGGDVSNAVVLHQGNPAPSADELEPRLIRYRRARG